LIAVTSDLRAADSPPLLLGFPIRLDAVVLGAERRFRVTIFAARFLFPGGADGFRAPVFFPGLAFFFDAGMGSSCF
jgi:hypothetical protein